MKQGKNLNTDFHGLAQKRNRTTSSVLLVLFAVSLFLFSSCPESFSPEKITLPEGKGSFSLSLSPARTILPNAPVLDDFVNYELAFTAVTGGENETVNRTNATLASDPVLLYAGTYNLTVTAYKAGNLIAARGTAANIVINPGQNTTASVMLHALIDEPNTEGTFKWNITLDTSPVTVTLATMKIFNTGGTQQGATVNLTPSVLTSGERTLAAGMYTVSFDLEGTQEGEIKNVKWDELLYVYATLESSFTHSFTDEHFKKISWKVTFNENYEGGSSATQSVLHGDTIASNTPVRSDYIFLGWYTSTALTTLYNFNSAVLNDFTLYAKWELTGLREVTIELWKYGGNDGWQGGAGLRINVNGTNLTPNATLGVGTAKGTFSGYNCLFALYKFEVLPGDEVNIYYVRGTANYHTEHAFSVYYSDAPPATEFSPVAANWNQAAHDPDGSVLVFRQFTNLTSTADGTLLGSFSVETGNDTRAPKINTQPSSIFYHIGGGAPQPSLSVAASSLDGGVLSYQWYSNTTNSTTGGTPVGSNSSSYSPNVSAVGDMFYYCVVTNTNNAMQGIKTASITSNAVRVRASDIASPVVLNMEPYDNLLQALTTITSAGTYDIIISMDQSLAARTLSVSGANIRMTSPSPSIPVTIQLTGTGSMFTINSGVTLTLGSGITLNGSNSNSSALVNVNAATAVLVMEGGSKISGNNNSSDGGGVRVASGGRFDMTGGEISGNTSISGGGVYLRNNSIFNMSGTALITGNTALGGGSAGGGGGGVTIAETVVFTMTGGTISNNESRASNGGGGVWIEAGTFNKTGGTIFGTDGGVNANRITHASGRGAAVFVTPNARVRNTTAGDGVNLNSGNTANWE